MHLPVCQLCGKSYPTTGAPFCCSCGGIYDFESFHVFNPKRLRDELPGIWKYKSMFGLDENAPTVFLGEGNTPLIQADFRGQPVWLKLEYQNPTGSYKDRGSAVLTSFLLTRNVAAAVEDSSGNAGASFAAYAARAGIQARVYVPESASGPKRKQIEAFGAELVSVPGPRSEAAKKVREAADSGDVYASHAYMPFGLTGIATISYEIASSFGMKAPGTIVAPVGHGGLLYGMMRGFKALVDASLIETEPYYVGVQAAGCAPIVDAYQNHQITLREPVESDTIAEGVRVRNPIRGEAILKDLSSNHGMMIQVDDRDLMPALESLTKKGFYVEPTSALVWAALEQISGKIPEPVVLILTGSGYKTKF